jgi:hypothetical protein
MLPLNSSATAHQSRVSSENEISAVFLYHFSMFVNWPDLAFDSITSPFRYCILTQTAMPTLLALTIKGEKLDGRQLQSKHFNRNINKDSIPDFDGCHILYIGKDSIKSWPLIKQQVLKQSILTVSNDPSFSLDKGGMISLLQHKNRIKPQINIKNVKASRLKISSKLLGISQLIN